MNEFVLTKVFMAHRWLWTIDTFARYEAYHNGLRGGDPFVDHQYEQTYYERFRFLLPYVLSTEDLDVEHRSQHDPILERLADIEATYFVFQRSVDFTVKLGESLKAVLAKPHQPDTVRDLLSEEERKNITDIVSTIEHWEIDGSPDDLGAPFWTSLLKAQREIDKDGRLSDESRTVLQALNHMKPKREAKYARTLLFILLAEFFDDYSANDDRTIISHQPQHEEYDPFTEEVIKAYRTKYDSSFSRFIAQFYTFVDLEMSDAPSNEEFVEMNARAESEVDETSAFADQRRDARRDQLLQEWKASKWHEKFGYERGLNKRRESIPGGRISERILLGNNALDLYDILVSLSDIKPPK